MANVTDYTALLTGSYWNGIEVADQPAFVTYSFDATAPASDQSTLSASAYATFQPYTAAQQAQAQQGLAEWASNSGLIFEQVAAGKGDINFASYNFSTDPNYSSAGGVGFYPFGDWDYATYPYFAADNPGSGNILMNTADETGGVFTYATVLHEEGHALGLKHPDQAWTDYASNPATVHNVWDPDVPLPSSVMNEGPTTLTHLAPIDTQAIQAVYGVAATQGTQDSTYSWNASSDTLTQHVANTATIAVRGISTSNIIFAGSGTDTISAIGAGTNVIHAGRGTDTLIGGLGTTTIYAGAGADSFIGTFGATTVNYSRDAAAVTVNLLAPYDNAGWAADDTFIDVHAVVGTNHGDTLIGDAAADKLTGGAGNDLISGGGGADHLTGGAGANIFAYQALSDSTSAPAGRDTITDFSTSAGNIIDLSALAANTSQPITFIGTAAFDGHAGELRYAASGANTLVQLDDTGKGKADFAILLTGAQTLTAADFRLSGTPPAAVPVIRTAAFGLAIRDSSSHAVAWNVLPHVQ